KVITLNKQILSGIPVLTLLRNGFQCSRCWLLGSAQRTLFSRPEQPKPLVLITSVITEHFPQLSNINLAVSNGLWYQVFQFASKVGAKIRRGSRNLINIMFHSVFTYVLCQHCSKVLSALDSLTVKQRSATVLRTDPQSLACSAAI